MTVLCYPNQRIAVIGLGKSGQSVIDALAGGSTKMYLYDDHAPCPPSLPKASIWAANLDDIPWQEIQAVVLSPGIPHRFPEPHPAALKARAHQIPLICDIDLLFQQCPSAFYVGVTGTNGKSTTTALIGHLLKAHGVEAAVGGNIGVPALSILKEQECPTTMVLELSSFQLELVPHLQAQIAVWLNLTPDHLDRYENLEAYIAAKKYLFLPKGQPQTIFIGVDDAPSAAVARELQEDKTKTVIPCSVTHPLEKGLYVQDGKLYDTVFKDGQLVCDLSQHPYLKGAHNAQNMMMAYGVTQAMAKNFVPAHLWSFTGLSHRQEFCGQKGTLRFINDSKGTSIEATLKALQSYDHIYLILGGVPKVTLLEGLEQVRTHLHHCFLIGQAQDSFADILQAHGIPFTPCGTLEVAFQKAVALAELSSDAETKTILLSPACASYDQFKNFEHRGDVFKALVASCGAGI